MKLPGLSTDEMRGLLLSVGTHHNNRKLTPIEASDLFFKAMQCGATIEECAEFVHLNGTSMVARFLKLQRISGDIKHLIDWGQSGATISFSSACEFVRLNEDEQEVIAKAILEKQLRKEEVKQIVQIRKRSKRPVISCIDEVVNMRPVTEIRYVYMGSVTNKAVSKYLEDLTQEIRNTLFEDTIKELFPGLDMHAGRLGDKTFTLVTDDVGSEYFNGEGRDQFEENVNKKLALRINDHV